MAMDLGLGGKSVLVTGASKGIGKACALGFAAEGARVALCARTDADVKAAADEARGRGAADVLALAADASRAPDVDRVVGETVARFGGVDVLVANVGGPPRGNFADFTDEQWAQAFDLTMMSMVRMVRAVLPHMRAKRWGRIVTIQSTSVARPIPSLLLSNALRRGVIGLFDSIVPELARDNILINTVCPGRTLTDRFISGYTISGQTKEEYLKTQAAAVPLGRAGEPEELASAVLFLASERASYITGVTLPVDGGLTAT
jgi:3-oxoacyl-[acyl-carrier protein] reductase